MLHWRALPKSSLEPALVDVAARDAVRVDYDCTVVTLYGGCDYSNILITQFVDIDSICHMFCGCVLLFTAAVHRALWYDKGEQLFRRRRRTDASLTYVLCRPSNLVSAVSINTESSSCLDLRPEMQP